MRKTAVLILLALLLLLCSCVTKLPYGDQEYIQALGLDGEFVITVNAELLDLDEYVSSDDTGVNYIKNRMTRLSVALYDSKGTSGPVVEDFSEYDYYGAIEGSFSKTLVNSALTLGSLFSPFKDPATKLKFYADSASGIEAAIPADGIILFSSTDVVDTYNRTFTSDREVRISKDDAEKLYASQIGIYVANPRAMIDLGFDISETALNNISSILMVLDDGVVSIDFRLKTEDLAESFAVIVKASYVGNLRREGKKLDIAALREMFVQELDTVQVKGMPLTEEQEESILAITNSLLDLL
ncbi:MAG: hypothetical protein J5775_03255 [Spirochaetales bacterium]|nr:hypothetical protein [Spirochaetales bacterium]